MESDFWMMRFVPAYFTMNIGLGLLALSLLCFGCENDSAKKLNHTSPTNQAREAADSVFLVVDYAADRADTTAMALAPSDTLTALDLLENVTTRNRIVLKTREFQIGTLVEQIGDCRNGDGGYWLYTVNGEPIPMAAFDYQTRPGDTVRFFFKER